MPIRVQNKSRAKVAFRIEKSSFFWWNIGICNQKIKGAKLAGHKKSRHPDDCLLL
jgi:hypothetical protein